MAKERNTSTRSEIINLLKTQGSMTVSGLAGHLKITEMAVRRHLNTLERDNLIESKMHRQAMGRPTNVYSLSEQSEHLFPNHYSDFALDVLQDLKEIGGDEKIESLFKRREERMSNSYRQEMHGQTLKERVHELAQLQNQNGYMVEVEEDPKTGDFILKEFNCPISQVAKEFSHACSSELSLFKKVLGADVERNECIAEGEDKCVYIIRNKDLK